MNPAKTTHTISLSLTEDQMRYLENSKQFLENETGQPVDVAFILNRLLEKGLPHFEEEMRRMRAKANRESKRFPRIHLAYSKVDESL